MYKMKERFHCMNYIKRKISEIGSVVTGKTPPTGNEEYYDGEYMFITPNELHGDYIVTRSEKTITEKGMNSISSNTIHGISIMVGCIGWDMGNVAICKEKCATNQQINSIIDIKEEYNPYYIYYWLKLHKDYLFSIASVTRTPILSKSDFQDIEIPIPDKFVQNKAVKMLKTIDDKIMLNNEVNRNLQRLINTIYEYWFIQFDFPNNNGSPYKSSGGMLVYNNILKREIPISWSVAPLNNNSLVKIINPGIEKFSGVKKYLATADVNGIDIRNGTYVDYETRESRANMQPTVNSVWFAKMKNSVKHLFFDNQMNEFINNSIISTGFCGLQCNDNSFQYISSFISNPYFETVKNVRSHGATQKAVNDDDLSGIKLLIPDKITLDKFQKVTEVFYAEICKNICENMKLTSIRDWLLPMLMNGQIEIEELESCEMR